MKVLLYFQDQDRIKKSGIGRALQHQIKALTLNGIEYTLDPKENFDIAHLNTYFGKSQRVLKHLKKRGVPIIVHGHSTFEDFRHSFRAWRLIEPYFDHCLKKMYSAADLIVTPTPYSKSLIEGYPFVSCPVKAVSNGIDLSAYQDDQEAVAAFKKHFSLAPQQKVVIGIGWFFHRKGLDDFVEVAKKMKDVTFIWFGHQPKWQTERRILKKIKSRPDNMLMPGYISGQIIKGALHSADLLFFPSYEETEGIVALEAMASHLPILVRDIPVFKPWLESGKSCYTGNSVEEFVDQIRFILKDPGREMILKNAYEEVEKKDLPLIGAELKKIYAELLKEKRGR